MALSVHTTGTGIGVASGVRQSAQLLSKISRHRATAWRAIRSDLDGARDDADALDCGFGLGSRGRDFAIGLDAGVHGLGKKILEEAGEVWLAAEHESDEALAEEISQLLYWTQVLMIARGLQLDDVYRKL